MSNFYFLKNEFNILLQESLKSESNIIDDPEVSAIYSRKSLENSVKFVYKLDEDLDASLVSEPKIITLINHRDFIDIVPSEIIDELHFIRKVGNKALHSSYNEISSKDALYANQCLYKFQRWIVEVYSDYEVTDEYDVLKFETSEKESKQELIQKIEAQKKLEEKNEELQTQLESLKAQLKTKTIQEIETKKESVVKVKDITEDETRNRLIDLELREAGYDVGKFKKGFDTEYKLTLEDGSIGYADYVIWGEDEKPLAVIEAKRFSSSLTKGKHQAKLYADALQKEFDKDVLTFVTNGRTIEYTNGIYPFREIHSFFPRNELIRALQKREALLTIKPSTLSIDDKITDRTYQKRVIKSVLKSFESYQMRALLVMATGTGKTRVSASLSDILIRANWVKKILFLADRKELVRQAKNNFSRYLKETCTNLEEKDLDNRIHFGTYETVHNLIRNGKYNSAYFDLIIVDEAHRTIYKKYKSIFEYFDSFILGLTATPADEVHRNTYDFFQTASEPTDSYDLATAINNGHLVDFKPYEIDLGIIKRGIKYDDLSDDEKDEFENKFDVDEEKEIGSSEINQRILNKETNEKVLQYLNQYSFKIDDGNKIGKTIIFAKNKKHAEYIKEVFDSLYPKKKDEAQIIHSEISHVQSLIDNFKNPNKNPQIAISVDMLDTGIDVPEILNLVFFKPIKSKIKFWQMIGRGTRLCPNIFGDGEDKQSFNIFDFCSNFSYFNLNSKGLPSQKTISLKERLFLKRVSLLKLELPKEFKDEILMQVKSQVYDLDAREYHLKKYRTEIEELQSNDLEHITDDVFSNLKIISEHIEDNTDFEVQRFQMLILKTEEAILTEKKPQNFIKEIEQRCNILKAQSNVNAVQEKIKTINKVIDNSFVLDKSLEDLEEIRHEIEHLANLSLSKITTPIKTIFSDEIIDVKILSSDDFIEKTIIQTEIQIILNEYIKELQSIKDLENSDLITDNDIDEIKYHIFDIDEIIENKINNNDEFETLIYGILQTSKKEVANKIFDNFISNGSYTQKQTEIINKIKNTLFGKKYSTIKESLQNVNDVLYSDIHPLANEFEHLNDNEQNGIFGVISLIDEIDKTSNVIRRIGL